MDLCKGVDHALTSNDIIIIIPPKQSEGGVGILYCTLRKMEWRPVPILLSVTSTSSNTFGPRRLKLDKNYTHINGSKSV